MEPISAFLERVGHLSKEVFLEEHQTPYLVLRERSLMDAQTEEKAQAQHAETNPISAAMVDDIPEEDETLDPMKWLVIPLRVPDGTERITVGRSAENDLCLNNPMMSKLHAQLLTKLGNWQLEDRASTNGTTLEGNTVHPGNPVPLRDGMRIIFAKVFVIRFYFPEALYQFLQPLQNPGLDDGQSE